MTASWLPMLEQLKTNYFAYLKQEWAKYFTKVTNQHNDLLFIVTRGLDSYKEQLFLSFHEEVLARLKCFVKSPRQGFIDLLTTILGIEDNHLLRQDTELFDDGELSSGFKKYSLVYLSQHEHACRPDGGCAAVVDPSAHDKKCGVDTDASIITPLPSLARQMGNISEVRVSVIKEPITITENTWFIAPEGKILIIDAPIVTSVKGLTVLFSATKIVVSSNASILIDNGYLEFNTNTTEEIQNHGTIKCGNISCNVIQQSTSLAGLRTRP